MSAASQKTIAQGEQQALMTPLFVIRKATIGSLRQAACGASMSASDRVLPDR
jgi:hypothetical protein